MTQPAPTQSSVLAALRSFILSILPSGTAQVTGSISGTTLTVTGVTAGSVGVGDAILGQYVANGTFVTARLTGTGGAGTYSVSVSQTVPSVPMWTGVAVVQGQVNRVPEPKQGDFVVMTPLFRNRLATNTDTYVDVVFQGSISGNTLTVTEMINGTIEVGKTLSCVGIAPNTRIMAFGSGTGGVGTYTIFPAQTIAPTKIAAGFERFLQPTEFTVQVDVHGPNSGDNAQLISTLFRDEWGTRKFRELNPAVQPLHADDPKQIPFFNGENQVENRWVITAVMQANEIVEMPMQFADEANLTVIEVDAAFPG